MNIYEIITADKPSLSFEVFPPKTSDTFDTVKAAALDIAKLSPSYMSVTYGAGGTTARYTAEIASVLLNEGIVPLTHITCVGTTKSQIHQKLEDLKERGIKNVLALRGDIPQGMNVDELEYRYASDLVSEISDFGGFCIGGACYPECHPESENSRTDIENLRIKVENGCRFLTTQMFFDNNILYNFMYRLYKSHIDVPVVAGIMPVTNAVQIKRIMSISQSALPQKFVRIVDRYMNNPAAMKQAGIAFATEQIIDLFANGVNAVHVYSMNKPDVAMAIKNNISEIIG